MNLVTKFAPIKIPIKRQLVKLAARIVTVSEGRQAESKLSLASAVGLVLAVNARAKKEPFAGGAGTYEGQEARVNP